MQPGGQNPHHQFSALDGCLSGGWLHSSGQVLKDKWLKTLLFGYTVWPAAHVVNFRFVPSELRVLYINCVQVCQAAGCCRSCGNAHLWSQHANLFCR